MLRACSILGAMSTSLLLVFLLIARPAQSAPTLTLILADGVVAGERGGKLRPASRTCASGCS